MSLKENMLINIKVLFTGLVAVKGISSGDTIEIPANSTVSYALSKLGIRDEHKKYIIVLVNEEKSSLFTILNEGDLLSLFLAVGGGWNYDSKQSWIFKCSYGKK